MRGPPRERDAFEAPCGKAAAPAIADQRARRERCAALQRAAMRRCEIRAIVQPGNAHAIAYSRVAPPSRTSSRSSPATAASGSVARTRPVARCSATAANQCGGSAIQRSSARVREPSSSRIEHRARAATEERPLRLGQTLARAHDLEVRLADVGEHADLGSRDLHETRDVAGVARAHLDDRHVVPLVREVQQQLLTPISLFSFAGDASTRSPYARAAAASRNTLRGRFAARCR